MSIWKGGLLYKLYQLVLSAFNPKNAFDTYTQDQTTRAVIAKFNQVQNSTTLQSGATKGAYTIDVTDPTGFVNGRYIIIFHPASENFSFYRQIGDPSGNIVTLDTPLDFSYPAGSYVDSTITNMNADGSGTAEVFGLRGTGAPPGVDIKVHITRLLFTCTTATAVDLTKFGDLAKLSRGLVLRKRDGTVTNIFNVKSNKEIAGIMFDYDEFSKDNPQQGVDGFKGRLTFNGQSKIGVAIELPIGDDLELLVQDDLRLITEFEVTAEGHIVE